MNYALFCTFACNYDNYTDSIAIFCPVVCHKPMDGTTGYQRDILSCQSSVTVVYGGLWNGGSLHIGHYFCVGTWYGEQHRYDVLADMLGLYRGLCGDCVRVVAPLLPTELDDNLQLFGTANWTKGLQDGSFVLPVVKDDGGCCAFLCGVLYTDGV